MIKLLLSEEVLIDAILHPDSDSAGLVHRCRTSADIQAWVLASAVQACFEADTGSDRIRKALEGITQIPVNAHLNELALASPHGIRDGLMASAARVFRIPLIIVKNPRLQLEDAAFLSVNQALALNPEENDNRVDLLNLNLALHPIFDRMDGWFMEIIQNTAFAGGNHVAAFEKEFAEYCRIAYAVGVSNGTDALLFALLAMGIKPGDEVITVPNTFIATTEAISQAGAKPVFVDVLPDTYLMNPEQIESRISSRTRAIIPVHLYGQIADMHAIMEIAARHRLLVLEDACQAHGARLEGKHAGTFGHAGCFSMYPGKNLGAFGEAGCIVTADPQIAETVACLREHGQRKKYYHRIEGFNGRMDNLQAAVLRAKLPHLDSWNDRRQQAASLYLKELADVPSITLPAVRNESAHVFHLFVILVPDPKGLSEYLQQKQIFTGFHYPVPLHLQESYRDRQEGVGSYPVSEACAAQLISLPMFPELTRAQILRVCNEIKRFLASGIRTGT